MTEINFYQIGNIVENPLAKTMAPLLLKILEKKKKALIYSSDTILLKQIDEQLWSFSKTKFIPHITNSDQGFDLKRQPVFLSNQQENSNEADYLIFFDEVSAEFFAKFSRTFHFFYDENLTKAKKIKDLCQNFGHNNSCNFYKKDAAGKWFKAQQL